MTPAKRSFFTEFLPEFVSGVAILPFIWLIAAALKTDPANIEWIAAPAILAYFSTQGWRNKTLTWPLTLPVWRQIGRLICATAAIVFVPVITFMPLYAVITSYTRSLVSLALLLTVIVGYTTLIVILYFLRRHLWKLLLYIAGLQNATTREMLRFGGFWVASLVVLFWVLRTGDPSFPELCREAGKNAGLITMVPPENVGAREFSACSVDRRGNEMRVGVAAEMAEQIVNVVSVYQQEVTLLGPRFNFKYLERVQRRPADTTGRIGP